MPNNLEKYIYQQCITSSNIVDVVNDSSYSCNFDDCNIIITQPIQTTEKIYHLMQHHQFCQSYQIYTAQNGKDRHDTYLIEISHACIIDKICATIRPV